ncbi:MAG TPA: hypothetical protein VED40_03865 [Azospirillaceae bacterium]|nr:hypothetical protein [Azospirillaceae bacterium]
MSLGAIERENRQYRRGLVLGFTLAEIITLIIFCLLLALASRIIKEQRRIADLAALTREQQVQIDLMKEKIQALVGKDKPIDDLFRELVLLRQKSQQVDLLRQQVAELREKADQLRMLEKALAEELPPDASPQEKIDQIIQDAALAAALRDALRAAGYDKPTPQQLREVTEALRQIIADNLKAGGNIPPAEAIRRAMMGRDTLAKENATLKAQVNNLEEALRRVGPGTELPPCWRDEKTGRPEYIFDVALTSTGMIVRDRALPHRAKEQAELPIRLTFGQEIATDRFLAEALPLYNWSVERKCRFFVRAFDLTGPGEKKEYKANMRRLEMRFYKLEVLNESF